MTASETSPSDHVAHEPRMSLAEQAPDVYRAMRALDASIQLDPVLRELIKIRASQLNGCAYCLDKHLHDARAAGEAVQRLDTLGAWEESPFFTARERAALALTDAITRVAGGPVPDAVYDEAARHFEDEELAQVIFAAVAINAWNRVAVSTKMRVPARS